MSISSESWPSYSSHTACLDFTPTPSDGDRFEKCQAFWKFVKSTPALERLKIKENVNIESKAPEDIKDQDEEFQPLCLHQLKEINKKGITKTVLEVPLPSWPCSTDKCVDPTTKPVVARTLASELKHWDRTHRCWSIPPSTRYTVPAAVKMSSP